MARRNLNLQKLYYNPESEGALGGVERLYRKAKNTYTRKEIQNWLRTQDVYTLHKPVRLKFTRNRTLVHFTDEIWQMDLVDMRQYKNDNDGNAFIITCIDIFSKFAWAAPLKNKTGLSIITAFKSFLKTGRKPNKVQTDDGSEFKNRIFQNFLKENKIGFYTTSSDTKASIVERFNRTLKSRMWRYFTYRGNHKYVDILQKLLVGYNSSFHRSIQMAPIAVNARNTDIVFNNLYPRIKTIPTKLNMGDHVRISKIRKTFDKGYLPNWTDEVFTLNKKINRNPPVWVISDHGGEALKGVFYEKELQKIDKKDDIWRIETIIEERGRGKQHQLLVKWLGYDDKHNSWINAKDLIDLEKNANR